MPSPLVLAGASTRFIAGLLDTHPKDKIRLARNEDMYQRALNGDRASFMHLGLMSRRVDSGPGYTYGPLNDGWTGTVPPGKKWDGSKWGWPTTKAADDAWRKYQGVAAAYGGNPNALPTIPPTTNIGNGGETVDPNIGTGGNLTPDGLRFNPAGIASGGGTLVVWLAGGAVLALLGKRLGWWR